MALISLIYSVSVNCKNKEKFETIFLLCFVYLLFFFSFFVFFFKLWGSEYAYNMLIIFRNFNLNTLIVVMLIKKYVFCVLAKQMKSSYERVNFLAKLEDVGLQIY